MNAPKKITLKVNSPCRCEDGKLVKECCLTKEGKLYKVMPLLKTTSYTGYSQPGCYLAHMYDCSPDLSAEHYISRSVLEQIGKKVHLSGFPWIKEGTKEVGINSLTSKILCRRHNSMLSPLDTIAGKFFKKIRDICEDGKRTNSILRKSSYILMSGEGLERWILKIIYGLLASKNVSVKGKLDDYTMDYNVISDALISGIWKSRNCGLYLRGKHQSFGSNSLAVGPFINETDKIIVGASLQVQGLEFLLIFDDSDITAQDFINNECVHRPSEINFEIERRGHLIALSWPTDVPVVGVNIESKNIDLTLQE